MKHEFSATWLPGGPADGPAPRVAVVFDGHGRANVFVDGQSGQALHLVVHPSAGEPEADFDAPIIEEAPVATPQAPLVVVEPPSRVGAPFVAILAYGALLLLATLGAVIAVWGARHVVFL